MVRQWKKRERAVATAPTEAVEMAIVAQWLNAKGVLWCHVPNEGKRSVWLGARMKQLGLKSGCPDILVFEGWYDRQDPVQHGHGIAVELKRINGPGPSAKQMLWIEALRQRGWVTEVSYGAQEAIAFISKYLVQQ